MHWAPAGTHTGLLSQRDEVGLGGSPEGGGQLREVGSSTGFESCHFGGAGLGFSFDLSFLIL